MLLSLIHIFIVHIARLEDLGAIVESVPLIVDEIAAHFWPGPLTMIFNKNEKVPLGTTGGLETVAVRMPDDEIARELILAGGGYVSAPSANTSGRPSPTTAQHVAEDVYKRQMHASLLGIRMSGAAQV